MKVLIGIPSNGAWSSRTSFCVARLTNYCLRVGITPILAIEDSSKLPDNRNRLSQKAINLGCDYLFFIDADMVFPPDILERLISANKEIVGCNYVTRVDDIRFTATGLDGNQHIIDDNCTGLSEVAYIATGLLLIKTEVFNKLQQPYFYFAPNADNPSDLIGEDYYFSHCAGEAGYKIYVDNDLSKEVGHIAQVALTYKNYKMKISFNGVTN